MSEINARTREALDYVVPEDIPVRDAWNRVVEDARTASGGRRSIRLFPRTRRQWAWAVAIVVAAAVPLSALAAATHWWFEGSSPSPTSAVLVVETGSWNGTPWYLLAYMSESNGVCYGVTAKPPAREVGALNCDNDVLSAAQASGSGRDVPPHAIGYLIQSSPPLPPVISGAVIDDVRNIEVNLEDGRVARTETIAAPAALGGGENLRFYVVRIPSTGSPRKVVGTDAQARIVAERIVSG
jgi:hypothetical protein